VLSSACSLYVSVSPKVVRGGHNGPGVPESVVVLPPSGRTRFRRHGVRIGTPAGAPVGTRIGIAVEARVVEGALEDAVGAISCVAYGGSRMQ
jgi:hypothetical protein